ncbi:MAG: CotH kinase family protein [Myxococcales bacterium]|nr:CotH kinase family protein [Myxococcales bacterium]
MLCDLFDASDDVVFANPDRVANVRQWAAVAAVEATLPASDNFWTSNYNLYIYEDSKNGWAIIPWDLDGVMYGGASWDASLVDGPTEIGDWWARMGHHPTWRAWFQEDVKHTLDAAYRDLPAQINVWCCGLRNEVSALSESPVAQFSSRASFEESCREIKAASAAASSISNLCWPAVAAPWTVIPLCRRCATP